MSDKEKPSTRPKSKPEESGSKQEGENASSSPSGADVDTGENSKELQEQKLDETEKRFKELEAKVDGGMTAGEQKSETGPKHTKKTNMSEENHSTRPKTKPEESSSEPEEEDDSSSSSETDDDTEESAKMLQELKLGEISDEMKRRAKELETKIYELKIAGKPNWGTGPKQTKLKEPEDKISETVNGFRVGLEDAGRPADAENLVHVDEMIGLMQTHDFDILVVQQTHRRGALSASRNNYTLIPQPRFFSVDTLNQVPDADGRAGGGQLIIAKEGVTCVKRSGGEVARSSVQYLHVEVTAPDHFHLIAIYSRNINHWRDLCRIINYYIVALHGQNIMFVGDFNINLKDDSTSVAQKYFHMIQTEYGLNRLIFENTHIPPKPNDVIIYLDRGTCIDHIFTNMDTIDQGVICKQTANSHRTVFCTLVNIPREIPKSEHFLVHCERPVYNAMPPGSKQLINRNETHALFTVTNADELRNLEGAGDAISWVEHLEECDFSLLEDMKHNLEFAPKLMMLE